MAVHRFAAEGSCDLHVNEAHFFCLVWLVVCLFKQKTLEQVYQRVFIKEQSILLNKRPMCRSQNKRFCFEVSAWW